MNQTFTNEKGHLIGKVSFDKAEIQKATDKAINKLVLDVTVPGFRKGKAPKDKAVAYLSQSKLYDATINALLRQLDKNLDSVEEFHKYVEGRKFLNGVEPKVSLDKFTNDEAEFTVVWTLVPELTKLGEYKGLKTEVKQKRVFVKDVEAELKKLAEENAELVEAEKEAEMGDTVNIDFTGLMNGQAFEGGSAKSFDLELGSHRFVPGFEEQLITHKAGDKVDVAVTLPDNYPEPLTGKAVVFKVVINSVKVKEIPEINDEFATTLSGDYVAKDLEELKAKVKAKLSAEAKENYAKELVNALLLQIRDTSEYVIPEELIKLEEGRKLAEDENALARQGLTLDEYLKLVNSTKEAYLAQIDAGIESQIKSQLVYEAVAAAEKIATPTAEEIEARLGSKLSDFAGQYRMYLTQSAHMSAEEADSQVNGYINQLFLSLYTAKIQDAILALNGYKKVEEKKAAEKPAEAKEEAPVEAEAKAE